MKSVSSWMGDSTRKTHCIDATKIPISFANPNWSAWNHCLVWNPHEGDYWIVHFLWNCNRGVMPENAQAVRATHCEAILKPRLDARRRSTVFWTKSTGPNVPPLHWTMRTDKLATTVSWPNTVRFFALGNVEDKVFRNPPETVQDMMSRAENALSDINNNVEMCKRICRSVVRRCEMCLSVNKISNICCEMW